MQKITSLILTGSILVIAATSNLRAQNLENIRDDKKIFYPAPEANIITSMDELKVLNLKVYKDFSKKVQNPTDLRVTTVGKEIYIYCFSNSICNRISYDKRGNWHHTLRYLTEEHLPRDVRHRVKSTYYDFTIPCVIEVNTADKTGYVITLEGKTSWMTITVFEDEMKVLKDFKKG